MSIFLESIKESTDELEHTIGLPSGFLDRLLEEDDWSFIVKAHAMIESSASKALTEITGIKEASDFFSKLEMSNSTTGKLALISALDILPDFSRRFIKTLSQLRNILVHDVSNTNFNFERYIQCLDKQKKKSLAVATCFVDFNVIDRELSEKEMVQRLIENPKRCIWEATMFVLAMLKLKSDTAKSKNDLTELYRKIAQKS